MNTPYGFKVKFIFDNSFKDDMLITFLKKYMKNFSYLQVSLTNKMLKKNTSSIMKIFQAYCGTNFIYHMKNKRIEDPNFFEELSLFNNDIFMKQKIVFHYSNELDKYIYKLANYKHIEFIIENTSSKDLIHDIYPKYDNIKFCIDFGHLFFKNLLSQETLLNNLNKERKFLKQVSLIHIHDFDEFYDHKSIGSGLLHIKNLRNFINKNLTNIPVIFEVSIDNLFTDGIKEIQKFENL